MVYTDDAYISSTLFKRKSDAHKGDFGKVLIFAGSPGMAGAAVLCGRAALKSGAGLVQYLLPSFESPLLNVLQICVPEATCVSMDSGIRLSSYQAVVCGSGLGTENTALRIFHWILDSCAGTLVADADALNMIARNEELAEKFISSPAARIITPHIGEARRLLHTSAPITGSESRMEAACRLAQDYRCISVLKGAGTLVADPCASRIFRNTTGNPGMATAGSGDSLAGLIGSLAAQSYSPIDAARIGVFIHGKAGDLAAGELGEMGVTSSDIVHYIPYALKPYYL